MWQVYIIKCSDDTLYTGITTDLERRIHEHNHVRPKASKYVYARRPATLMYSKEFNNRAEASKEEWRIKQLSHVEKIGLLGVEKSG